MYRASDDAALVRTAEAQVLASYAALVQVVARVAALNARLVEGGVAPIPLATYTPPPAAMGVPASVDLLQGQRAYYAGEAARLNEALRAMESALAERARAVAQLRPGPRAVPAAYIFAELSRGAWSFFKIALFPPFTMLIAPFLLLPWYAGPLAAAAAMAAFLVTLWGVSLAVATKRLRLLARGEVGTVLQKSEAYSGLRLRNWPVLWTNGWDITLRQYSGLGSTTTLTVQTPRGRITQVTVRTGPSFRGVVLVDPETGEGLANCDFASAPRPDARGEWDPALPGRVWAAACFSVVASLALAIATLVAVLASLDLQVF
ncbi:hypothetical protein WMF18_35255 [Sorangium sp. So ce315]|uniref:hypothetical protein n=1 Tax=Sorangium sp. So ce315 TaxID=3133299 RepID=UPI003F5FD5D8